MKIIAWLALSAAVLANVVTNISLKLAVRKSSIDPSGHFVVRFFIEPWTWVAVCAGIILLASYLVAIRDIGLGFSYALVTSVALVLITISAAIAFQERLSPSDFRRNWLNHTRNRDTYVCAELLSGGNLLPRNRVGHIFDDHTATKNIAITRIPVNRLMRSVAANITGSWCISPRPVRK